MYPKKAKKILACVFVKVVLLSFSLNFWFFRATIIDKRKAPNDNPVAQNKAQCVSKKLS